MFRIKRGYRRPGRQSFEHRELLSEAQSPSRLAGLSIVMATKVQELLSKAESLGARFTLSGNKVEVEAPEPLPPELMAELRQHKADIVTALQFRVRSIAEDGDLLTWARNLAQREVVLTSPVHFYESRLFPVWVTNVGAYTARHLATIAFERSGPRFNIYNDDWYSARAREAIAMLRALQAVMKV